MRNGRCDSVEKTDTQQREVKPATSHSLPRPIPYTGPSSLCLIADSVMTENLSISASSSFTKSLLHLLSLHQFGFSMVVYSPMWISFLFNTPPFLPSRTSSVLSHHFLPSDPLLLLLSHVHTQKFHTSKNFPISKNS